jgi:alpha-L-arabinofuranosidase
MKTLFLTFLALLAGAANLHATEFYVSTNGDDSNPGTSQVPFRTIQQAADVAQPGDVITVHSGIYRERVNPPRGGTSNKKRIIYQAAPGEKVVITGSEPMKGWVKVTNDTWKVTISNSYFGKFNPYADRIHGDWCSNPRGYHTGAVYLNGDWLTETTRFGDMLKPAGRTPFWFAKVDGVVENESEYLMNIAFFQVGATKIPAENIAAKNGTQLAACSEGGQCVGFIRNGNWLRYDGVNFGAGTESVEFRAAAPADAGGEIELRLDNSGGELLGVCDVPSTGGWQKWQTFTAKIKPVSGGKNLCLVFKPTPPVKTGADNTVIYAQFPGVNPNEANVEINVRQTVFTPSKTGINYITVRGFELRDAAAPWAPPTAAQIGIISAYWCKGWIIESNNICYSPCCGVALGKYGDEWDNRAQSAEGYVGTIHRAMTNGWNKATVGSHIVRDNEISHCEQTGIVGSMGCSFSTITGNDIHDIHIRNLYSGAEMAGIKFHGAIDVVISHNHIYRTCLGIWLDWMAQGAQVTGNLFNDNRSDIFFEMQHGPILVANNLFLSRHAFSMNSQGIAFVHNLVAGPISSDHGDRRVTPFQQAHTTALGGMYPAASGDSGDDRFYNNLFAETCNLQVMNNSALPCFAAGNVFTKGAQASKFDTAPVLATNFDADVALTQKADGWYLTLAEDKAWRDEAKRQLVTTALLGKAKVSGCAYDNHDGSPVKIDTDYFGRPRNEKNPFPGPFEDVSGGKQEIKVWPLPKASAR